MPIELLYLWLLPLAALGLYRLYRAWSRRSDTETKTHWQVRLRQRWLSLRTAAPQTALADPAKAALPDETAAIGAPLPSALPAAPPTTFTMPMLRLPITALLLGGLILIMMGQTVYPKLPAEIRPRVYLVMLLGLGAFLLGTQVIARQSPPAWLVRPAWRICRFLDIRAWQTILLILAPCYAVMAHWAAGPALQSPLPFVAWSAWLIAAGMAVAGSLKWQREQPLKISRLDLLLTVGLLVGAYLLRGTGTAQIPTTLSGDEGSVGLTAVQFLDGRANNPLTVGWFSFPSFYFALTSLSVALFGNTAEALRIPSALAGAFGVVGVYWLARALFDRPTAALAAAYLLASHYHIHFSRIGLNNIFDGLFATVGMAGLWHGWKTGRRVSFVVAGIALGIGQYFYVAVRVVPVLFLIWAVVAFLTRRTQFKQRFPDLALSAFIALMIFLPLGLFFWSHPEEFSAPINRVTIFQGWLENEIAVTELPASQIIREQMVKAALGFTQLPLRLLYDPGVPLLLGSAGALFLVGVFIALWQIGLRTLFILLPLISVVFLSGFSQDPPASQRYIVAMPLVAILLALPLGLLWRWLRSLWPEYRRLLAVVLASAMLWLMWTDVHYYFGEVYKSYILGGLNTEAATEIAAYLHSQDDPAQEVYFFGFPRMGYGSLSTIPFINPQMQGVDVPTPLQAAPDWPLEGSAIFIFLPERIAELDFVRAAYPEGRYRVFYRYRSQLDPLFMAYEVQP